MGMQPYSPPASAASGPRRRDRLWLSLIWLLLCGLCLRAGFWQLDRAGEKQALLDSWDAAATAAPRQTLVSDADADDWRYRTLELRGRYAPERQVLLDNRMADGRSGYEVLTPFLTNAGWVLVNRGWLPADPDRNRLPVVDVGTDTRTIIAQLNRLPEPGLRMAEPASGDAGWPRRLLYPSRDGLAAALGLELPDYQLLLAPDQPDGYRREWAMTTFGPATHYGYAMQWFAFAGLTTLFYVLLLRRQGRNSPTTSDEHTT